MADNTRPRYVNPPNNPNADGNMADWLGNPSTNSLPNPSLFGGNGGPMADPYEALQQVLSNLNPVIAPPPQGKFQQIMNLIANAAVVGTAQDPSAALANQLAEKRKQDLFYQQANIARQNKLEDVGINVGLQKAQDLTRQREEQEKFRREAAYRTQEREATQRFNADEERQKEIRQLNIDSIKRDWKIEDIGKEARLQKKIEAEFLNQDLDRLTKFENVKNIDERRAARDQKMVYYMMAGISADVAKDLADSYISGKELTPSQSKLLDRAGQFYAKKENQKFAAAMEGQSAEAYYHRKAGDAAVIRAGVEKAQQDKLDKVYDEANARALANLSDESFVIMKDGSIRPYSEFGLYKQMGTLPPGAARMATHEENITQQTKLYEAYRKDAEARKAARGQVPGASPTPLGSPQPQATAIPTPNATPGAPPTANENLRMQVGTSVQQAIKGGMSPEEVNRNLDISIKEDPANAQIYEGFKIRTAGNPQALPSPTPSATPVPGTSVDDYNKKRRESLNKTKLFGGSAGSQVRKITPEEKAILDEVEKQRAIWEKAKDEFYKRNNP